MSRKILVEILPGVWLAPSKIDALIPYPEGTKTLVLLEGGQEVAVYASTEAILDAIEKNSPTGE